MRNIEVIKTRYLLDNLSVRLGGIAANLARIASFSSNPANWEAVQSMLEESEFFIEWTVPDACRSSSGHHLDIQFFCITLPAALIEKEKPAEAVAA
jgi:hypothetical protein